MSEERVRITTCRSCGAPIAFVRQPSGKLAPMCVERGAITNVNHFSNCPERAEWRKRGKP